MKNPRQIIKQALLTEKGTNLKEKDNKYLFAVDVSSNRIEIKRAVEELFKVKVKKVTTMNMHGKVKTLGRFSGKRSDWKKAYVQLEKDNTIELFEKV